MNAPTISVTAALDMFDPISLPYRPVPDPVPEDPERLPPLLLRTLPRPGSREGRSAGESSCPHVQERLVCRARFVVVARPAGAPRRLVPAQVEIVVSATPVGHVCSLSLSGSRRFCPILLRDATVSLSGNLPVVPYLYAHKFSLHPAGRPPRM